MTHFNDYTIMRALVMDFGKDKNVLDISDQFMFGPALMACPVYTYKARQREVYFPDGNGWYDFYTGKHITGGQTLTVDPMNRFRSMSVRAPSSLTVRTCNTRMRKRLPKSFYTFTPDRMGHLLSTKTKMKTTTMKKANIP